MADVFISYASQDRLRIKPLAEALEARGFSVWWDRALGAGEDYTAVITRELAAARAVIVVWTDASVSWTFVRDEGGRARDDGRLVPLLLDKVQIPLGFGAFQAEDFTKWNGQANAPQMQLLEEVLRAKLEGRSIDGGAVAAKRRRLMARVRIVSVLSVILVVGGIALVGKQLIAPPPVVQQDPRAQLLDLLNQGKLTPEQAIELARLLEAGALGNSATAENAAADGQAAGAPAMAARSEMAAAEAPEEAQVASVSEAEFDEAARDTFRQSMAALLVSPDAQVRRAALQLSNAEARPAAMQALQRYAAAHPAASADIYRVVGAVGAANDAPGAEQALEQARNSNPQDAQVWRMLSYSYRRAHRAEDARAAALVSSGLQAQARGQTDVAQERLEAALPQLQAPEGRAFVEGQLGDVAAQRNDWTSASRHFGAAYDLRARAAPDAPAASAIQVDAQKYVRALDRDGRTAEACHQARQAQEEHNVAPEPELTQRCAQLNIEVAPAGTAVRPQVRPQLQVQPRVYQQQQTAPARQP
ncbi:MAG: TIR domain-containing protein [Hyphomonadaceae bacterium]